MQASGNKSYSNYALHWIKIDVESTLLILLAVLSRFLITEKLLFIFEVRLWKGGGGGGTNGDYISSDGSPILTLTLIDNHKCGELYRAPSPTCYISAAQ